ncbi:MAG: DUF1801 domain-containing protein [Kineosporiaceae bacterium]
MQSTAVTVDEYLATVPNDRLEALNRVRDLCLNGLAGYTEGMQYGMPSYSRNGVVEVAFNSQKHYISVYILNKDVLDPHRDQLKDAGRGCIRYRRPDQIDFGLLEQLIRATAASSAPICP